MQIDNSHPFLNIGSVDFNNVGDVNGFANLLIACASADGRQSIATTHILSLAKAWINYVQPRLMRMTAGDALSLFPIYDLVHRIAYNKPADSDIAVRFIFRAFEAHIHGDSSVDIYHLYRMIRKEIRRQNMSFFDRPLMWCSTIIERWFKNFTNAGSGITPSPYNILSQSEILINDDLFINDMASDSFKYEVFKSSYHFLNKIEEMDINTLDAATLFLDASAQYLSSIEYEHYSDAISAALISHPETNRFHRAALQAAQHQIQFNYDASR